MIRRLTGTLMLLLVPLSLTGAIIAQESGPALAPGIRDATVESVAALVERHYVLPDAGREIAEHIRSRAQSDAYLKASTPTELAQALTTDLQAINDDLHLTVSFDPMRATALGAGAATAPEQDRAEARQQMAERERRANFFVEDAEVLPGNVGYLRISQFSTHPEAFDVVEQALRLLARTDAMIFDLRAHGGGSARMANFLISHFTKPDLHSLDVYWRSRDELVSRHTLEEVPGPRRPDVPLYVLVDPLTGSAGEDVPFVLQNLGRATVVGETTAGMGRNNRHLPTGEGFVVSVSVSRVMEPGTGREWERVGVVPDMEVPAQEALTAAHLAALERIAGSETDDARKAELALFREYVEVRQRPVDVDVARLRGYAGEYQDGAEVIVEEREIRVRPGAAMPLISLDAISEKRFSFGPARRVIFAEDEEGRTRMEVIVDGRPAGVFLRVD